MKFLKYAIFCVLFASLLSLTACGDKDDDEPESEEAAAIVGNWRADYEEGYTTFKFSSDGSFYRTDVDYEYGTDVFTGDYEVRGGGKYLTLFYDSEDEGTETCTIVRLTASTLVLMWEEDDVLTLIRQK